MKLESSAFQQGKSIPSTYTCDGKNTIPPLTVSEVPTNAKSLVLFMDDPDIPDFVKQKFSINKYDHWILFNIPPSVKTITEKTGTQGKNSSGKIGYTGPCPPDREHRYFFKLYALDCTLPLTEGSTKTDVENAMKGHILAETTLMAKYKRKSEQFKPS